MGAASTITTYRILNMDCPTEEALIRKKLASLPGIIGLEFNLMQRVLMVSHQLPSTEGIETALVSIGMTPELLGLSRETPPVTAEARLPWARLAVAGLFAAVSEGIEFINVWGARPFGLDVRAWQVNGAALVDWLPLIFALLSILFAGLSTYRKGWLAVKNFNLNINALMSVAVTGAILIGQYPEAAMVMVLFNLAEAIEAKSLNRARTAIKNLLDLTPETATVLQPASPCAEAVWVEKDVRLVAVGSRVRIRPGERVPLDGIIVQGRSSINQAPITGESLPVDKEAGDLVYGGTINESGSFVLEVTAEAANSTLARIIHVVEKAQGSRAPIQRFVDRFAAVYTPAIFLIALLTAVIPPLFLDGLWLGWIYTALVILVIGCPCALVIATPVTIVSGMAAAARQGILVKGGIFIEQSRLLTWLALDKTGTITRGRPVQTDYIAIGSLDDAAITSLAASLAARSDHPVSRALAEHAAENGVVLLDVDDFTAVPGLGLRGTINGAPWRLGNQRMVEALGLCSPALEEAIVALETQGKSVVALISENGAQGLFAVADTLKDSSAAAIRELGQLGIKTMLLTGDNEHTARAIAVRAGVDAYQANLLPEDKLAAVKQLAREAGKGTIGMAGDGINDAPALAGADVGFAMAAAGTDTAIETADVALMDDDLRKIPRFVKLSRATYAILMQNITLALGIKAIFFILTFMGLATMWMAVFADVGASLLVVANGLRAMNK
ncbi:MAG: heavy metal translocating P-type ATPase [Desulfovibrionaceae bacterium]|nr:heavy metal translocating P-type ATPase [Desulfovibrionaceae bacterium]